LAGSNRAAKERNLDKRRVPDLYGSGGDGLVKELLNPDAKRVREALSVSEAKANVSGKKPADFGLRAAKAGSQSGLGHALGGQAE
jgi:hypothetical protein